MDSKEFVEYLKTTLQNHVKTWGDSILSGSLSPNITYDKAVGILEQTKGILNSLDNLHSAFLNKQNSYNQNSFPESNSSSGSGDAA